jgi:hypothetical protein
LRADHHDLRDGLLQDHRLDDRLADLHIVLKHPAVGQLLQPVYTGLHQARFPLREGLIADNLSLEGDDLLFSFEHLLDARQCDRIAISEDRIKRRGHAILAPNRDACCLKRLCDRATGRDGDIARLAVRADADGDVRACDLWGTATDQQSDGQCGKVEESANPKWELWHSVWYVPTLVSSLGWTGIIRCIIRALPDATGDRHHAIGDGNCFDTQPRGDRTQ